MSRVTRSDKREGDKKMKSTQKDKITKLNKKFIADFNKINQIHKARLKKIRESFQGKPFNEKSYIGQMSRATIKREDAIKLLEKRYQNTKAKILEG